MRDIVAVAADSMVVAEAADNMVAAEPAVRLVGLVEHYLIFHKFEEHN